MCVIQNVMGTELGINSHSWGLNAVPSRGITHSFCALSSSGSPNGVHHHSCTLSNSEVDDQSPTPNYSIETRDLWKHTIIVIIIGNTEIT